jgi:hypothetical protein
MNHVPHKHIRGISYLFLFFLALCAQPLLGEGFLAGTAVHTPAGFRPIEEIEPGHEVLSFDRFKQLLAKNIVCSGIAIEWTLACWCILVIKS